MTIENDTYGGGYAKCSVCQLVDKHLVDGKHTNADRCARVLERLPLGPGIPLPVKVSYDLTEEEVEAVNRAVDAWQSQLETERHAAMYWDSAEADWNDVQEAEIIEGEPTEPIPKEQTS